MRSFYLTFCVGSTTKYLFGNFAQAFESEDDAISLLQTSHVHGVHAKRNHRYGNLKEAPKSLEDLKLCISELAESKEVVEQDVEISDTELTNLVHKVKACAGDYGMTEEEYLHFMKYVRDHAPQKLLVWGLGADSLVLDLLNYGGETLFLEPDFQWIKALQQTQPGRALHVVNFNETLLNTTVTTYQEFLVSPHRADAVGPLQGQPCWDTVLVDSPIGSLSNPGTSTGRAVPIYTAFVDMERCKAEGKYAKNAEASVFVHDSDRPLEDSVAKAFFTLEKLQHEVGPKKLRQFCLTCSTTGSISGGTAVDELESIVRTLSTSLNVDLLDQGAAA